MNCDAIARYYAWMEFVVFGRALERCRTRFLTELEGARRALVLGDGDGRFLVRLLESSPRMRADYVDRSQEMLELARRRTGNQRVNYYCADALRDALPEGEYDVVTTHFFFDCFERRQLEQVIERIASAAPGARWVVSDFRVPEGWLGVPARMLIHFMYRFFGLTTGLETRSLVDHRPLMQAAGFRLTRSENHARGFLVSELWTPAA